MQKWQALQASPTKQGLTDLFDNQVANISIENFLSPIECANLIKGLRSMGLQQYAYNFDKGEAPPAACLFETHYLYEQKAPAEYFPKAKAAIAQYRQLTKLTDIDPVKKLMQLLEQAFGKNIEIAQQDHQEYSYVLARELNHSALVHADFAAFIPKIWSISNINAQYAWNIYLSDPGEGGECIVYNKPWELEDDQHIKGNTYGYDPIIVKEKEFIKIKPKAGMLSFFNSRNFHEVLASSQARLSLGGHVGRTPEGKYLFWV